MIFAPGHQGEPLSKGFACSILIPPNPLHTLVASCLIPWLTVKPQWCSISEIHFGYHVGSKEEAAACMASSLGSHFTADSDFYAQLGESGRKAVLTQEKPKEVRFLFHSFLSIFFTASFRCLPVTIKNTWLGFPRNTLSADIEPSLINVSQVYKKEGMKGRRNLSLYLRKIRSASFKKKVGNGSRRL